MTRARSIHTYLTIGVVVLAALFIIWYTYEQLEDLRSGPIITIQAPISGQRMHDPFITIHGEAQNIAHLVLNDRQIFVDESGQFREQLLLLPGYTIITLDARDRFDRKRRVTLELVHN